MNWEAEVIRKKDDLIKDTQSFLQIESVLDEEGGKEGKPFGEKVDQALQYMLKKGKTKDSQSRMWMAMQVILNMEKAKIL